jgi:hypothetical protein
MKVFEDQFAEIAFVIGDDDPLLFVGRVNRTKVRKVS